MPDYDHVIFQAQHKLTKPFHTKYMLTAAERRKLISETSDQASMLYEYYLRMVAVAKEPLTDKSSAAYFGWTEAKAKRYRLALTAAGYFKKTQLNGKDKTIGVAYYIGKSRLGVRGAAAGRATRNDKEELNREE